jgi:hypothetical protein
VLAFQPSVGRPLQSVPPSVGGVLDAPGGVVEDGAAGAEPPPTDHRLCELRDGEQNREVVEGLQFDRGYISPYFVTDDERLECVLDNPSSSTRRRSRR